MKTLVLAVLLAVLALLLIAPAAGAATLDEATREALLEALDDERRSEATYRAALERFGAEAMPFAHIVQAEKRHSSYLLALFEQYGLSVPADRWQEMEITLPATRQEACAEAVAGEIRNADLYDRLLATVQEPDVRQAFTYLRDASREHHLPAFQRCAEGGGMGGPGRRGGGGGMGMGMGRHGGGSGDGSGGGKACGHGGGHHRGCCGGHGSGKAGGCCGHHGGRMGSGCCGGGPGPAPGGEEGEAGEG